MRTLYLLRHAAAESHAGGRGDHARELTEGGRAQASAIGAALADTGVQLVISSSATRALQTAEQLGLTAPVWASDDLYNGSARMILDEVAMLPVEYRVVLVVGHAPGVGALALELADEGSDPDALAMIGTRCPPATLAGLEFDGGWPELTQARLFTVRLA